GVLAAPDTRVDAAPRRLPGAGGGPPSHSSPDPPERRVCPDLLADANDTVDSVRVEVVSRGGAQYAERKPARRTPRQLRGPDYGRVGADAAGVEQPRIPDEREIVVLHPL